MLLATLDKLGSKLSHKGSHHNVKYKPNKVDYFSNSLPNLPLIFYSSTQLLYCFWFYVLNVVISLIRWLGGPGSFQDVIPQWRSH